MRWRKYENEIFSSMWEKKHEWRNFYTEILVRIRQKLKS